MTMRADSPRAGRKVSVTAALALFLVPGAAPAAEHCSAPPTAKPDPGYASLVAAFHRQLDIPEDYADSRHLELQPEVDEKAVIAVDPRQGVFEMSPEAADAWLEMQAAARTDGVELFPVSAFRPFYAQVDIVSNRRQAGEPIASILRSSAAPGYSEHHTGDAIDVSTPHSESLSREFAETEAYDWLRDNAARYCFRLSYPEGNRHGIRFEPWHWRYQRSND